MIPNLPSGRYLENPNPSFTQQQQVAICEDMRRWRQAREVFLGSKGNLLKVREWISCQPEGEFKEDMRRRLNVLRKKYRGKKPYGAS